MNLKTACRQRSGTVSACMRHCSASAGNDHGDTAVASSSERLSCFWNNLARVAPRHKRASVAGRRGECACANLQWASGTSITHVRNSTKIMPAGIEYSAWRLTREGAACSIHADARISWFGCSSVSHHTRRQRPTYQVIPSAMCSAARKRSCGGPCISRQSRRQVDMSEELRLRRRVHDRACAQPLVPNMYLPLPSFAAA